MHAEYVLNNKVCDLHHKMYYIYETKSQKEQLNLKMPRRAIALI